MEEIALFDGKRGMERGGKKLVDPKQSQRQQTNSIIKAIGRLWTRKLHERLWGLDQWQSGAQIMLHCSEHQTNTRRFINGG